MECWSLALSVEGLKAPGLLEGPELRGSARAGGAL